MIYYLTMKNAYKYLPKGKWMCLNIPDLMYEKLNSDGKCDKRIIKLSTTVPKWKVVGRCGMEYILQKKYLLIIA